MTDKQLQQVVAAVQKHVDQIKARKLRIECMHDESRRDRENAILSKIDTPQINIQRGNNMSIKDTSNQDPIVHLAGSIAMGTSDYILSQKAQGQSELVNSEVLPSDMLGNRETFEKMGIVFGENVDGDDMFINCTLPKGWKKQATDHSMWSELVDEKGRKRASIFYKAAFYDRSAHMDPECRIKARTDYSNESMASCVVYDQSKELFRAEKSIEGMQETWHLYDEVGRMAEEWVLEHWPKYKDPTAYWDLETLQAGD